MNVDFLMKMLYNEKLFLKSMKKFFLIISLIITLSSCSLTKENKEQETINQTATNKTNQEKENLNQEKSNENIVNNEDNNELQGNLIIFPED